MNLKQLEVFLAVADSGSFSRGAEATFITQSTVSQHVAALEQEFGLRLFDRTGRGALLTEGGKVLAEHARRLVRDAAAVESAIARFKGVEDVSLRIGGSSIPGSYMIPAVLPNLLARFPKLHITLVQGDSSVVLDQLAQAEVEVAVVGSTFQRDDFRFTPLGQDSIILVLPAGHPWQGRATIEPHELAGQPLILRETGSGTGRTLFDALSAAGVPQSSLVIRAMLGSNEAVKQAVLGGVGGAFLSAFAVQGELARGELITVAVSGVALDRSFYLALREGREPSPATVAFMQIMTEMYGACH